MATGFSIPPRANTTGGLSLSSGDDQDNAIIGMALGEDETEHSFQQNTGIGDDMIFDTNDPLAQAAILGRLRKVFATFTRLKRFKLLENTIQFTQVDGDMILSFKYLPMETGAEPQNFSTAVSSSTGVPVATPSNNAP
jgi:hypothetical protein